MLGDLLNRSRVQRGPDRTGDSLLAKPDNRLQQLRSFSLTTNVSNKSGTLLFAQSYLESVENDAFLHSSYTGRVLRQRAQSTVWRDDNVHRRGEQDQEEDGHSLNFHSHRIARIFCESEHESTLRAIPSFFMRKWSVERFIPSRIAAPLGPDTTHLVSFRIERMCSRSTSTRV